MAGPFCVSVTGGYVSMSIRSKVLREIEKKPRRLKELKEKLGNNKKVQQTVEELVKKGKIRQKNGTYFMAKTHQADGALEGTLVKLGSSFGFVAQKEGPDVFIPARGLNGALLGDGVLVKLFSKPKVAGSLEGEILAVTKPRETFVGTVEQEKGRLYFVPDECPYVQLLIKKSADGGAKDGDKVAAEVLTRGEDYNSHKMGVALRFGSAKEAKHCAQSLLFASGISRHFPEKVKEEASHLQEIQPSEIAKRNDYRDWPIFTIDSAQTKDIDDAISLFVNERGYELGVHIADVSYYVKPGSELNWEAMRRGTSIYYADSVIPMLPRQLSNGLCSLNEAEDRLAFSCIIQLDQTGQIQSYRFEKTVIRSRVKGVYSELNALLADNTDAKLMHKYQEIWPQLPEMKKLYEKRAKLRKARGGIALESTEAKLILDEEGRCVDIHKRERGLTESMIEEFMLLANQCAAKLARENNLPFVYRVHEQPEAERVERLQAMLRICGLPDSFHGEIPSQKELAALLDQTKDTPLEPVVHTGVLRSMAKAKYEPVPKGHYGLALEDYTHFTSPIRRYPDLAIHRILSDWVAGEGMEELHKRYELFAQDASAQSSTRELAAMQLERSAESCYKAEYMQQHLGEEYDAIVSGVAPQGIYVELENTVEGLVRVETFCKGEPELIESMRLRDRVSGKQWSLGDTVRVKVIRTDVALGRIDFVFVE